MTTGDERTRVAAAMAVRELVRRCARWLGEAGIPVMPLKGALLQATVYREPSERMVNDVDLLVPAERFDEAEKTLLSKGFSRRWADPDDRERILAVPGGGFSVDLHRELFPEGQFALRAADVLSRATADTATYGERTLMFHPLDLYAHLLGHLALTYLAWHEVHHPRDLGLVLERFHLHPKAIAEHLSNHGLASAARWALPLVGDDHARAVLSALPREPLADAAARLVPRIVRRLPVNTAVGLVPLVTLHRRPRAVVRALTRGAARRIARRIGYHRPP